MFVIEDRRVSSTLRTMVSLRSLAASALWTFVFVRDFLCGGLCTTGRGRRRERFARCRIDLVRIGRWRQWTRFGCVLDGATLLMRGALASGFILVNESVIAFKRSVIDMILFSLREL